MADMQTFNNDKKMDEVKDTIAAGASLTVEQLKGILVELINQSKISVEAKDAADEQQGTLNELLQANQTMVDTTKEQTDSLSSLSASAEAAAMAKDDKGSIRIVDTLKTLGGQLGTMIKQNVKSFAQEKGVGKLFNKVAKVLSKNKEKKTKVTEGVKPDKGKGGGGLKLDAKQMAAGIGSSISGALSKILNPIEMVKAFFEQLFPLLLIAGILIYAFVTGWFDGDLMDALGVLIAIIIVAILAYIAYCYIKELFVVGVKIVCEFLKVAIEAAADWAAVYVIIAVVAVIGIAFLLAAALIIIIIGLALVGIVIAVWFICKAITSMIEDMTEDIMEIMAEQFAELGEMINSVVSTFATLVPMLCSMMVNVAETLKNGITKAISGIAKTFTMMTAVMQNLSDQITHIFNGLAAAILASVLGQAVKKSEDEIADLTVNSMTAEFEMGGYIADTIAMLVADEFADMMDSIADTARNFIDNVGNAITEPITEAMSGLADVIYALVERIIDTADEAMETIKEIGFTVMMGISAIVGAFITILFAMPLVGLMMGLLGTNSFSKAIEPLININAEIEDLLHTIVASNRFNRQQTAVPSNTISSSEQTFIGGQYVNGDDYNTFAGLESRTVAETDEISSDSEETSSSDDMDVITPELFAYWMQKQYSALKALASKDGGSGGFLNLFM